MRRRISVAFFAVLVAGMFILVPSASSDNPAYPITSSHTFIVQCAFSHMLQDDPIKLPGDNGGSHWHDFYANPRTNADSTVASLRKATVHIVTASVQSPITHPVRTTFVTDPEHAFAVNDSVRVQDMSDADYNGVWTVNYVNGDKFKADILEEDQPQASGGTAGDAGLTCGQSDPLLTYDTAAYWFPSAFLGTEGTTHIEPPRIRVYYFGDEPNLDHLEKGLQIVGGKHDAVDPDDNPHVHWHCGQQNALHTPNLNHPYDCTPFQEAEFVDGPVGVVEMPWCFDGAEDVGGVIDETHTVYPQDDGDPDNQCDAPFDNEIIHTSLRVHLGSPWENGDPMNPCSNDCNAYLIGDLEKIASSCTPQDVCKYWVQVADVGEHDFTANEWVTLKDVNDEDQWDGDYQIDALDPLDDTRVKVKGLPGDVPNCTMNLPIDYCGSVADPIGEITMRFTLAGGDGSEFFPIGTQYEYYKLHADFFQTWDQVALGILEDQCANAATGCEANIDSNEEVDELSP